MSGIAGFSDRIGEAIAEGQLAIEELRATDDTIELLAALANMGLFLSWRGEFAAADRLLAEARRLRDRVHGRGNSLLLDLHHAGALRDLGAHDEARALLEETRRELASHATDDPSMHTDLVLCENHLAQLWLLAGDPDRALAAFATDAESVDERFRLRRETLRLRAMHQRGDQAGAEALASMLRPMAERTPSRYWRALAELELLEGVAPKMALAALAAISATDAVRERPGLRLHVHAREIEALLQLDQRDAARANAADAQALQGSAFLPVDFEAARYRRALQAALAVADSRPLSR
jgi:hypothetical protein